MQRLEPSRHLNETVPYFALSEARLLLLVFYDLPVEVATICVLHHDTKST